MPVEEGYNARIMPQAGAAMPLASPETFGAAVYKGAGELGDTIHETQLRAYQIERKLTADRWWADFSQKSAAHRQGMDQAILELRNNPTTPDYGDHVQRVMEMDQKAREGLLAGAPDENLLHRAQEQLGSYSGQLHDSELTYAETRRIAKFGLNLDRATDLQANRIQFSDNPATFAQEIKALHDSVGGLQNVPPEARDKWLQAGENKLAMAYGEQGIRTNPAGFKAQLEGGLLDGVLSAEGKQALLRGADIAIRQQQIAGERVNAAQDRAYTDRLGAVKERAARGEDVSSDLPDLYRHFATKGDQSVVEQIKTLDYNTRFAKVWETARPEQRQARIADLNRIAANKRTGEQAAELHYLTGPGLQMDRAFQSDPVGFMLQHGQGPEVPPALDGTPNSFAAREQWARAQHLDKPLSDFEAKAVADTLHQSGGYQQAIDQIGHFSPAVARQAAVQVAPSDLYLQQVVTLPTQTRRDAMDGRAALKANPKLVFTQRQPVIDRVNAIKTGVGRALEAMPQDQVNAVFDMAKNLTAKDLHETGTEIDAGTFERNVHRALGGIGWGPNKTGGISGWVNRQYFLVPDGMTANQFTTQVFRWVRSHPQAGPANRDKSPFDLKAARPVAIGAGRYKWKVGGADVLDRNGNPFIYTVGSQ